jgi:hypothetical protein
MAIAANTDLETTSVNQGVNENTVYIEKFEDIGMLDPTGS